MTKTQAWWETTPLTEMDSQQWESLCDHCGKCCLNKLEDEEDGMVYYTDVACDLVNDKNCHCSDYPNRSVRVPTCVALTPENLDQLYWMPPSCAYRLVHEGESLPDWHHLVCGDKNRVHAVRASIKGRYVKESSVTEADWEEHVVDWPLEKT